MTFLPNGNNSNHNGGTSPLWHMAIGMAPDPNPICAFKVGIGDSRDIHLLTHAYMIQTLLSPSFPFFP